MNDRLRSFFNAAAGATKVEFAIVASLAALGIIFSITGTGGKLHAALYEITTNAR